MSKLGSKLRQYLVNLIIAHDYLANAWLAGSPDETISSRIGKRTKEDCLLCHLICRALDIVDPGHCEKAIKRDRGDKDVIK